MSDDKVYVAIYDHRHGQDVSVYKTEASALAARDATAACWWERELPKRQKPDTDIGDIYFHIMGERGEEFFSITPCEVEQ